MKSKYLFLGLLALASCSQEEIPDAAEVQRPEINSNEPFLAIAPTANLHNAGVAGDKDSRVSIDVDLNNNPPVSYRWETGDHIGIFPQSVSIDGNAFQGDQVYFQLFPNAEDKGMTAKFDQGPWNPREGYSYRAYYPFNRAGGFGQDIKAMKADFTRQKYVNGENYIHDYVYMVSNGTVTANRLHFNFDPMVSMGWADMRLPEVNEQGSDRDFYVKKLTFSTLDGSQLFCLNGTFDLTAEKPVITPTTLSNELTITTDEAGVANKGLHTLKFIQPPLALAGKEILVTMNYTLDGTDQVTMRRFKFGSDWKAGEVYRMNLWCARFDPANKVILTDADGVLCPELIQQVMGGTGEVALKGEMGHENFRAIRETPGVVKLDLRQTIQNLTNPPHMVGADFFTGMKDLRELSLPGMVAGLQKGALDGLQLTQLTWDIPSSADPLAPAQDNTLEGFDASNCDLVISEKAFGYITSNEQGEMLFLGKMFKSYTQVIRKEQNGQEDEVSYKSLDYVSVDAATHTLTANKPGFLTAAKITEALGDGAVLKVAGTFNDKDLATVAAYKAAALTALTFDNADTYVPADNAFTGCTYSATCDLVIPDAWKSQVTVRADGKVMWGGVAWKSIQITAGVGFGGVTDEEIL